MRLEEIEWYQWRNSVPNRPGNEQEILAVGGFSQRPAVAELGVPDGKAQQGAEGSGSHPRHQPEQQVRESAQEQGGHSGEDRAEQSDECTGPEQKEEKRGAVFRPGLPVHITVDEKTP